MTSNSLPVSQQMYFSTHNALRINEEDDSINTLFYELNGNRHISLLIFPFYDVQMLKRLLIKKLNLPRYIKVNDIIIIYKGIKLPNYRIISSYLDNFNINDKKKKKKINKFFWAIKDTNPNVSIRVVDKSKNYPPFFENMLNEIKLAFNKNISPKLTMDGTGGTYLLYNGKKRVCSVFKPIDEEAFAPFNPRGYEGKMYQQGFRAGVLSGEGASREIAAYLLDNSYNNFSSVPCTIMVEACHPSFNNKSKLKYIDDKDENNLKWKCGSLQEFVDSKESVGNYDYKQFSIRDIHKIAILDIRVMNLDRNDGNILVSPLKSLKNSCSQFLYRNRKFFDEGNDEDILKRILTIDNKPSRYSLIPIDHGLILPHIMDVAEIDLVWFEWPQTKVPFDDEELLVIFTFDPDKDAEKIRKKLLIREECIRTMRVCTRLLQIGARMHLNLHEIAKISTRKTIDEESVLEHLVKDSIVQAYQMMDCTALMSTNRLGHILDLAEIKINKKKKQNKIKSVETCEGKSRKEVMEEEKDATKRKNKKNRSHTKDDSSIYEMKKGNSLTVVSFREDISRQKEKDEEMRKRTEKGKEKENNVVNDVEIERNIEIEKDVKKEKEVKVDVGMGMGMEKDEKFLKTKKCVNEMSRKQSERKSYEENLPFVTVEKREEGHSKNIFGEEKTKDNSKKKEVLLSSASKIKTVEQEQKKGTSCLESTLDNASKNIKVENCDISEMGNTQYIENNSQKIKSMDDKDKWKFAVSDKHSNLNSSNSSSTSSRNRNKDRDKTGEKDRINCNTNKNDKCCTSSNSDSFTSSSSESSSNSSSSSSSSNSSSSSSDYSNMTTNSSCYNERKGVLNKDGNHAETEKREINAEGDGGTGFTNRHINKSEANCKNGYSPMFNGFVEKVKHGKKKKKKKRKKKKNKEGGDGEDQDEEDEEENDTTFKKPTGTLKRINENAGTAYRNIEMNKINSIWMIRDKNNKIINVKWENQNFEKLFFETFENHVIKYINDNHPNWRNYEYYGYKITSIRHSYLNGIK